MEDYSIVWGARTASSVSALAEGTCVLRDNNGEYLPATTANRALFPGRKAAGLARSASDGLQTRNFNFQFVGIVDKSLVPNVGAGAEGQTIYVDANGQLARGGAAGVDDIVGTASSDGTCSILFAGLSVAPGALTTISAGDGVRITGPAASRTVHGVRGTCSLEQFGAVGDGVTDDSAALTAALAAVAAGTYGAIILGAKTYYVPGLHIVPTGCTIAGQGDASVLRTDTDTTVLRGAVDALNITLRDFQILGNATGSSQHGVEGGRDGVAGTGVSGFKAFGVKLTDLGGYGMAFSRPPQSNTNLYWGPIINGCEFRNCAKNLICTQSAEYGKVVDCQFHEAREHGVWVGAGNWSFGECHFTDNAVNLRLVAGTNDTHGQFTGCHFNHPSGTTSIVADAGLTQGHTFVACHFYEGDWSIGASTCVLNFVGCIVDPETVTNAGALRFTACMFPADYFVAWTDSGNGWTQFVYPIDAQDGTLASFVESRMQRSSPFSSDANETLSWPESVAETLIIPAGVISTTRQKTSRWGPEPGRRVCIVNNNAQSVTFAWASGTAVTIPAGKTAVVGADGTNAFFLVQPDTSGGSFSAPTGSGLMYTSSGTMSGSSLPWGSANTVLTSTGSAGSWATIVNANVNAAAAIAGTKISPNFGSQSVVTTDSYAAGSTPATVGQFRTTGGASSRLLTTRQSGSDFDVAQITSGGEMQFGSASYGTTILKGYDVQIVANNTTVKIIAGGTTGVTASSSDIKTALPVAGDQTQSMPFRFKVCRISASGDTTLSAAQYECPLVLLSGSANGNYFDVPNQDGGWYCFHNFTAGIASVRNGGSGSVVDIGTGKAAVCWSDSAAGKMRGVVSAVSS